MNESEEEKVKRMLLSSDDDDEEDEGEKVIVSVKRKRHRSLPNNKPRSAQEKTRKTKKAKSASVIHQTKKAVKKETDAHESRVKSAGLDRFLCVKCGKPASLVDMVKAQAALLTLKVGPDPLRLRIHALWSHAVAMQVKQERHLKRKAVALGGGAVSQAIITSVPPMTCGECFSPGCTTKYQAKVETSRSSFCSQILSAMFGVNTAELPEIFLG